MRTRESLTLEEHEVLEHVHQLRHLAEDEHLVASVLQLRQNPVQQLELARRSVQQGPAKPMGSILNIVPLQKYTNFATVFFLVCFWRKSSKLVHVEVEDWVRG